MRGHNSNIEELSIQNENFRRVLYTSKFCQLVLMSLKHGEEIGDEVHDVDQFFRIEKGQGEVVIDGVTHTITDGSAVVVPAGAQHNVINTGSDPLKLYTIYMPPHHKDGTVHKTKEDALNDDEHFDGIVSE